MRLLLIISVLMLSTNVLAVEFDANGKWETSLNYAVPCSQRGLDGMVNCNDVVNDGLDLGRSSSLSFFSGYGEYTKVVHEAAYPGGAGMGLRMWKGGTDSYAGSANVHINGRSKELWIRWYMRWQYGFKWRDNVIGFNKLLYVHTEGTGVIGRAAIPSLSHNYFSIQAQGAGADQTLQRFYGANWQSIMGGDYGDGQWHAYEVHIKMDTVGEKDAAGNHIVPFDGIAEMWLDGEFMGGYYNVNFSNGTQTVRDLGWNRFTFIENHEYTDNINGPIDLNYAYIDMDEMVVYVLPPPNIDPVSGSNFIGTIDWTPPDPTCANTPGLCLTSGDCLAANHEWVDGVCVAAGGSGNAQGRTPFSPSSRARFSPTSFTPYSP